MNAKYGKVIIHVYGGKYFSQWWKLSTVPAVFSAYRVVHFPVGEEDQGTGLALCLTLSGCQDFCGIVPNGPASSYLGSFNKRQGSDTIESSSLINLIQVCFQSQDEWWFDLYVLLIFL